jgi:hypothetical protein
MTTTTDTTTDTTADTAAAAALAAAIRTAQQAADAGQWQAAARQLTHAAGLARALAAPPAPRPAPARPAPAAPDADAAGIADHLRGLDTTADGAAYLAALGLDLPRLQAVAAALLITRADRLSRPKLTDRILHQAITARRKYAGLRKW